MLSLAESDSPLDRIFLAAEPNVPTAIQRILAQDSSIKVRRRLAANPCIDPGIATHIAASEELAGCKALAQNPSIPATCIEQLCTHPDDQVALLVAYRDDLTSKHLDLLLNGRNSTTVAEHLAYQNIGYDQTGEICAETLARSPAPSHRNFAARSARLSPATLARLSNDLHTPTRLSVANAPGTAMNTLRALTLDPNREVLMAAEDRLARTVAPPRPQSAARAPDTPLTETKDRKPLLRKLSKFFKDQ
jgi:hypothetical protein